MSLVLPWWVNLELSNRIEAGRKAVLNRVDYLHHHFGKVESSWKTDASRVTEADLEISRSVFADLSRVFDGDDFFSEELETGNSPEARMGTYSWVLDPIDGTNNYALGVPFCAISLALLRDGFPVYGFVYDHARRRLIAGGPGHGVHDGSKPCTARTEPPDEQSLVGMHSPAEKALAPTLVPFLESYKARALGSSTLQMAYVACGIFHGALDYNVKVWDIAAAHALCLGAGVEVHYLNGNVFPLEEFDTRMPRVRYLAGTPAFCRKVMKWLPVE